MLTATAPQMFDEGHLLGQKVPWGGGDEGRDADDAAARNERKTGVAQDFREA